MTNTHPALQPVLRQTNVVTLLNHLQENVVPPLRTDIEGPDRGVYRDGFKDGLAEAANVIRMMWQSAVIAAEAANDEATRRYEELVAELADQGDVTNDTLGELSAIARDLLDLAERLEEVEG